jgi:tRNA pseudouridine65 synthase
VSGAGELLSVLYQDSEVVAVEKPAWAVVHPTRGARGALVVVRALAAQLDAEVFPVHRLDRQTSGVLLLARSATAAATLGAEFREERVRKTYLGLCRGALSESLRIDRPVPEGGTHRPACTEVEPLEVLCGRYTFLRARPRSGRRHQIRYHLKHASHPLAGDTEYGRGDINRFFRERFGLHRLFLHAESLRVLHPTEPRFLELASPLPADLGAVLERLRAYNGPVV